MVTPFLANMVAGGSQLFRLVDLQGRPQQNVSWDISGPAATGVVEGNDLVVTGQEPGESRVVARSAAGRAEAKVTVLPGTSVPMGTVIWSAPSVPGCKPGKVVPAIPTASGVDVYQMSDCPDGEYLSAYTPEGMLAYRRKVSGAPGAPADAAPAGAENIAGPQTLNLHAASICDGVAVGTEQGKVREAMQVRGLKFSATSGQREVWLVEEPGVQCKLWFDENRALTKKQKILVAE